MKGVHQRLLRKALSGGATGDTRLVDWLERARAAEQLRHWDEAIALVGAHAECFSDDPDMRDNHLWQMDLLVRAAYSSRRNRSHLGTRGIKAVVPEKKGQAENRRKKGRRGGRPIAHDTELYKDRNTVERTINKIKDWRGLAVRYDKRPDSYQAALELCDVLLWIRHLGTA